MRRRIRLAVSVGGACALLAVGAGIASAAPSKSKATKTTTYSTLKCAATLATVPPAGSAMVEQPTPNGNQFGFAHCPLAGFGSGVIHNKFVIPQSGDLTGKYTEYFSNGTLHGKIDLAPQESSFNSGQTFTSESFKGTLNVLGGTGALKGVKGEKVGTMSCTSADSVHFACTEKVRIKSVKTS